MKLTPEQIQNNADAVKANLSGKQVEISSEVGDTWVDIEDPSWDFEFSRYRPKPETKTRAWNCAEDVPGPVCWIKLGNGYLPQMVIGFFSCVGGAGGVICGQNYYWSWDEIGKDDSRYSTDRNTWQPCTVVEP